CVGVCSGSVSVWNFCVKWAPPPGSPPMPCHFRRHDPQERRAPSGAILGDRESLVWVPVAHRKTVRDNAGPRLEIENLWTQLQIDARQEKHRDHRGLGKIAFVQISFGEGRLIADPLLGGVALR